MLASVGIGHQNSPLFAMYLLVGADGGGYTISVPIKMRYLHCMPQAFGHRLAKLTQLRVSPMLAEGPE